MHPTSRQGGTSAPQKSASDPTASSVNDVRANIARLEARAQTLLGNLTNHVVRSGPSVLELSHATAADIRRRNGGDRDPPAEMFLANIGFDVHEQQRLLQQMAMNQPTSAAAYGSDEIDRLTQHTTTSDVLLDLDKFLAMRRSETLQNCVDEIHRQISDRTREIAEQHIRSAWDRRAEEIHEGNQSLLFGGPTRAKTAIDAAGSHPATTASAAVSSKMNAFAHIVDVSEPHEWVSHFAEFVLNCDGAAQDEIVSLWSTLDNMLSYIAADAGNGGIDGVRKFMAASRAVLERKFLVSVFRAQLGSSAATTVEHLELTHSSRLAELLEQFSGPGCDYWTHVYLAMRCGRYDTAQWIATQAGNKVLQAVLTTVANTPPIARNSLKPFNELRNLFSEEGTRSDPRRAAVLAVLLVSSTGLDHETSAHLFNNIVDKAATSIEDMLWMRLACIRNVDSLSSGISTQSLLDLQNNVLADVPQLLAIPGSSSAKVASVLLHSLLPSTAMRLLLEDSNENTVCDAVHMALSLYSVHLLRCTSAEAELNLSHALQTYVLRVLDHGRRTSSRAGPALFKYFTKTSLKDAFIHLCRNPVVCTKLLGQSGEARVNEGALLQGSAPCSQELLHLLTDVAKANADDGQVELAVHIYLVIERLASQQRNFTAARESLVQAIVVMNPVLSHSAHHVGPNRAREQLLVHAIRLRERLASTPYDINGREKQTFDDLCTITEFHSLYAKGEYDQAANVLLRLKFIPVQLSEVDDAAQFFNSSVGDEVATAMPPTILTFLRMEQSRLPRAQREGNALVLVQMAKSIVRWTSKWRSAAAMKDFLRELQLIEAPFSA